MYSVIRFQDVTGNFDMKALGEALNLVAPGLYTGMDRVAGRFSCGICDDDDWKSHRDSIHKLLSDIRKQIQNIDKSLVDVEIDIALDFEDGKGSMFTEARMDTAFIRTISDIGIVICVTVYHST